MFSMCDLIADKVLTNMVNVVFVISTKLKFVSIYPSVEALMFIWQMKMHFKEMILMLT